MQPLLLAEHLALLVALLTGLLNMWARGWSLAHPRWLLIKLGLVAFVVVPMEAMHAWVNHVWLARALREQASGRVPRAVERGIGMDDMLRTLAVPVLLPALALIGWLSLRRP